MTLAQSVGAGETTSPGAQHRLSPWQGPAGSLAWAYAWHCRSIMPPLARTEGSMLASQRDLADVLARVAQRDRSAFETLYKATSAKLYGVVLHILVQRSLADEIVQDVYVRIWERAGDFNPAKASPIAWMAAIARNRALDEIRRQKVMPTTELPEDLDLPSEFVEGAERMEASDRLKSLIRCLGRLEAERRSLVLLAYYRGCSREALAERFGRPVPTIKTWLHRSLAQLRACLES